MDILSSSVTDQSIIMQYMDIDVGDVRRVFCRVGHVDLCLQFEGRFGRVEDFKVTNLWVETRKVTSTYRLDQDFSSSWYLSNNELAKCGGGMDINSSFDIQYYLFTGEDERLYNFCEKIVVGNFQRCIFYLGLDQKLRSSPSVIH